MLKKSFDMKDLDDIKFFLGLEIEILPIGILMHQTTYIEKTLKQFNMLTARPLISPMVVQSLENNLDVFKKCQEHEQTLGFDIPSYLSTINALMYLANQSRPDISFVINVLALYSADPMIRHWNDVKHVI